MAIHPVAKSNHSRQSKPKLKLVKPKKEKQIQIRIEDFKNHLLIMKGLGPGTIANHCKIVKKMLIEIGTVRPTLEDIRQRAAWMYSKVYSYHHIVNTLRGMEAYMEYLGRPIKLGRPRKPKSIPKETLTEAEIAVILAACKNVREKAMLSLLAYSGMRNEELCNLKVKDIDFGNNLVRIIQGKGSKDRCVPITGECVKTVLKYLAEYSRDETEYLFTTLRKNNRYSEWSLRQLVKTVTGRTFIKKRVHPHLFRHSLATNMLMRGANIFTIQQQLGHADIKTTMIYLNPKTNRLLTEYQAFAPSYI